MKIALRKLFNSIGLDIHRIEDGRRFEDVKRLEDGKLRWSHTAEDYYPVDPRPRWGHGRSPHTIIRSLLESRRDDYLSLLKQFRMLDSELDSIPYESTSVVLPCWNNTWFSTLDAAALVALIFLRAPTCYLEIGSGISTKFARFIIVSKQLSTTLVSVDPHPRAEIDSICDEVVRQPLEELDPAYFNRLSAGDILFFDGSHRTFANSDVTTFFFDVLPRLKPGVLIHVHDIFWPDDYPPEWNWRLYSEQYLLGALLLGGANHFRVVLPNYFVSSDPLTAPLIAQLNIPVTYPGTKLPGVSFWFETTS
jgi:hypothetical protein